MSVKSLWHAGFTVDDIERSIAFWTEAVGMVLRHRQIQENEYTSLLVGFPDVRLSVAQLRLPEGSHDASGHVIELIEYQRPASQRIEPNNARIGSGHIAGGRGHRLHSGSVRADGRGLPVAYARHHGRHQSRGEGGLWAGSRRHHVRIGAAPAAPGHADGSSSGLTRRSYSRVPYPARRPSRCTFPRTGVPLASSDRAAFDPPYAPIGWDVGRSSAIVVASEAHSTCPKVFVRS
jgi:catechol 2,3-dioxygenase-like lactoylglutathione lyase family enzyme